MDFELIDPLWDYQESLRKLDNENKARLAIAGWNLKALASALHQMIPDRLEPRVMLRGASFLTIVIRGGFSIHGAISRFQDLNSLKKSMEGVEKVGSPAFAFSSISDEVQFFRIGCSDVVHSVSNWKGIERALRDSIFLFNPGLQSFLPYFQSTTLKDMTDWCASYFCQLIPAELDPDVQAVECSTNRFLIKVEGKPAVFGYISTSHQLTHFSRVMMEENPNGCKTFAFMSWWATSGYKCQFFEFSDRYEEISQELDYERDEETIRLSLHHCIGFNSPEQYGRYSAYLCLPVNETTPSVCPPSSGMLIPPRHTISYGTAPLAEGYFHSYPQRRAFNPPILQIF